MPICNSRTRLRRCPLSALKCLSANWNHLNQDILFLFSSLEWGKNCHKPCSSYSQKECFIVALLFFVFSEFIFSLTTVILSSIYVTIDTPASSAAELCLEGFFSFTSVMFLSKILFYRFLVLASVNVFFFYLSGMLHFRSKQRNFISTLKKTLK